MRALNLFGQLHKVKWMTIETGSSISLPSFRKGIEFDVKPLNLGGTRAMMKATNGDNVDVMMVMLTETLKREFPNVTSGEIDKIEQDDFVVLIDLVSKANKGLEKIGQNAKDGSNDADKPQQDIVPDAPDFTPPVN